MFGVLKLKGLKLVFELGRYSLAQRKGKGFKE